MLPIVCVVGASNAGKTTFLEKLIPELTKRGYRVGCLKHDAHSFEMDHPGKDTYRHRQAGARTIAIASPDQVAAIRRVDSEPSPEEMAARLFWDEDILLTEGYKRSNLPKIEVFRSAIESKPICTREDHLVALVTDDAVDVQVPRFRFHEADKVADFIEERFLKHRKKHGVLVQLDGKQLPMKEFVRDFVVGAIRGMLSSLRGWEDPRTVHIHIRLKDR